MNFLFIHQNFPAQFASLATFLAQQPQHRVAAIGSNTAKAVPGVMLSRYALDLSDVPSVHTFARRFDIECRRAEQIIYIGSDLLASGFVPDAVFVHCGWGESLPVRALFPRAKIVTYCEYFYRGDGLDVNFDPEWPAMSLDGLVGLRARNASTLLALAETDIAISPTAWQRATFPTDAQQKIHVRHEGIDVETARPDPTAGLVLPDGTVVHAGDEVVTYVSRNLEPMRGYHVFMRSLPQVLQQRPRARVIIVGGDGVSYGLSPASGTTWKDTFLNEVRPYLDVSRVHFLGRVPYDAFIRILQVSQVHVYLTYPFVLSWSLLEAMSAGCLVVGSATGPLQEVIDGRNGLLVDFFDIAGLAERISQALANPTRYEPMRQEARRTVLDRYQRADCVRRILDLI
jgi:glycosyltransferase involved in cell wall biosynthesis